MNWWRRIFGNNRMEQELDAELRHHFDLMVAAMVHSGMTEEEARRATRLKFGGHEQIKQECRESRGVTLISSIMQDLQVAFRQLSKNPIFAAVSVLTLAIGIGANTAIFTVIDALFLRPLPYAHPAELVTWNSNESLLDVIDIRLQSGRVFSDGGAVNPEAMDYTGGEQPLGVDAGFVDAGLFQVLGVPAMLGRTLSASEDRRGGPHVVVLAYPFWQNHLGGDPAIVGKSITLSGIDYTVIGVMPAGFAVPELNLDLFVSLWAAYPEAAAYRGVHFMRSYWRLKPGVTLDAARQAMGVIDANLKKSYPDVEKRRQTIPVSLQEMVTGNVRSALQVLYAAVSVVLLIACANFASLLMARSVVRSREMAIRAALGGGRIRLLRQMLTESGVLAMLGGTAGITLAWLAVRLLVAAKPAALAHQTAISMDNRVLLFGLFLTTLTGILFGLAPAWSASGADAADVLKGEGRNTTAGLKGLHFRRVLVVGQIALAVVLLAGAGLLIRSFARLLSIDPGFNPENVTAIRIQLPASRYGEIPRQTVFRRELLQRLNALPGVEAAMVGDLPLSGNELSHTIAIEGQPAGQAGEEPEVDTFCVMGDYFRLMGIPLIAGRAFTEMDREGHPLVAIINQATSRELFPHESPLGQRIHWARDEGAPAWMTIVGVVGDIKQESLAAPVYPAVFTPFSQSNEAWRRWMSVVLRAPRDSAGLVPTVKRTIWSLDDRIPVDRIETMDALLGLSLSERRFNTELLSLFGLIALILSTIGIYSVMAYTVSQRSHEIGIRVAIGARHGDVMRLIMGQGARLAAIGLTAGLIAAFALNRAMRSLLFEIAPNDPVTIGAVTLIMLALTMLACYIPARRAIRVDAAVALRCD